MARQFSRITKFTTAEDGAMSGGGLIFIMIFLTVGGLAVDISNAINQRTQLQLAADAAAHTALYVRNEELDATPELAKAEALTNAGRNMPGQFYGSVLTSGDIDFGVWDAATRTFSPDPASRTAVRVETHRDEAGENEIATYLLKFAGVDSWNVRTAAVFETYVPTCLREGFVAENMVDIQSNNSYFNGFCIHSNDVVAINSNNYFEEGTVVSMPDQSNLDLPSSGFDTNAGLQEALRYGAMQIRLINALREVRSSPFSAGASDMWEYIRLATRDGQIDDITASPLQISVVNGQPRRNDPNGNTAESNRSLQDRDNNSVLRPFAVNYVYCASSSTQLMIQSLIKDVVIITNCQISFGSGGAMEDALLATLHTGAASISGSASTRIGKLDDCARGGGAQLISLGGMDFSAGVSIHGSQLIALKEIEFAANADGLSGTSIISGDTVSGTSNMEMGLCGTGMEDNLSLDYFRMVQ